MQKPGTISRNRERVVRENCREGKKSVQNDRWSDNSRTAHFTYCQLQVLAESAQI